MFNKSWDVNNTSTHLLTHTLAPLLIKSPDPRLMFMTSGTANLTDHSDTTFPFNRSPPKGWPKEGRSLFAYRSTKVGLNMIMLEWKRLLAEDGVKVWSISPGMLATDLGGVGPEFLKKMGAADPSKGGDFIRTVVEGERDADVGKVVGWMKGPLQPW